MRAGADDGDVLSIVVPALVVGTGVFPAPFPSKP
jgi:hypothetical protein